MTYVVRSVRRSEGIDSFRTCISPSNDHLLIAQSVTRPQHVRLLRSQEIPILCIPPNTHPSTTLFVSAVRQQKSRRQIGRVVAIIRRLEPDDFVVRRHSEETNRLKSRLCNANKQVYITEWNGRCSIVILIKVCT